MMRSSVVKHHRNVPRRVGGVSDALDDDDLQLARAVLLAVCRGLKVFGRLVAADRLLEAREIDDDEAVEFFRALEDLALAAARQELAAEFPDDRRARSAYFWYCSGSLTFERATQ